MKLCRTCGRRKLIEFFSRRNEPSSASGRVSMCKACAGVRIKEYAQTHAKTIMQRHRRTKYGLTDKEYRELYRQQKGRCAICRIRTPLNGTQATMPHVDHDHAAKRVRGLLCGRCNRGLGMFKDNARHLHAAADYLNCL